VTYPDGGTISIRDPAPDDPELWYWTAVDLIHSVRAKAPNRNLNMADGLLAHGEWELAIQAVLYAIRDDPEPKDLVVEALKERIDRLRPDTHIWGFRRKRR
jgi:hypothetical protein